MLSLDGIIEQGRTLGKAACLVQRHYDRAGNAEKLREKIIVFWVPTTTALPKEPLYPTYSLQSLQTYSSAFFL